MSIKAWCHALHCFTEHSVPYNSHSVSECYRQDGAGIDDARRGLGAPTCISKRLILWPCTAVPANPGKHWPALVYCMSKS
ncbi:hypothetical protein BD311DRAFT_771961 [Dichomitus squalens]|uniref:Uncharacterized protein n=1 Tax=Dichomitus squalens TaxID=114155 RepID=A0A4Q9M457_9APHY|nr:hypothetical protein BD311DRAFT_771961 [Dichomitus squalens]